MEAAMPQEVALAVELVPNQEGMDVAKVVVLEVEVDLAMEEEEAV